MPNANQMHVDSLMSLHTIKGVEIFATGTWNGRQIQEADLDAIVESFAATSNLMKPHLKLGHNEKQELLKSAGLPAAGWVENVRKVGSKLQADFVDIPRQIYQLIKNKAYRKVSCEIYNDIEIEGKKHRKLLGAVALLGAETPGVMNLRDILSQYAMNSKFKTVETFTSENSNATIELLEINDLNSETFGMDEQQLKELAAAKEKLQADLDAAKAQADTYKADLEAANKAKVEAETALAQAKKATEEAEADKFVADLQAEKLCSKAMAPLLKAAVSSEVVEKYSFDGKDYSRQGLLKEILKGAAEAAKVNFSNQTANVEKNEGKDDLTKVEAYAKEHGCSYSEAYRQLNKKA